MTVIGRVQRFGMRAAVHVNRSVSVRPADVEDVDALQIGELDELDAVRCQELAEHTRGLTACVGFELVLLAVLEDGFRPRLKGCVLEPQRVGCDTTGEPHAFFLRRIAKYHVAARCTRSGPWWTGLAPASPATLATAALATAALQARRPERRDSAASVAGHEVG